MANLVSFLGIISSMWLGYLAWKPNKATSDANITELYTQVVAENTKLNNKIIKLESMIYKAKNLEELQEGVDVLEKYE